MAYYSKNVPGSAHIFKPSMPAPVQVIDKFNKEETARKSAEAKAAAEQAQENRKNLQDALKYNPEAPMAEYDAQLKQALNEQFIPKVAGYYKGGRVPAAHELADIRKSQNDIEIKVGKIQAAKDNLGEVMERTKNDKEINQDYVYQKLEDFIYTSDKEGRKALKEISDLDPESIKDILSAPEAFNRDAVLTNFANAIPANMESIIKENGDPSRPYRTQKQIESKFLILDNDGNRQYDENGNVLLNLTPETLRLAYGNGETRMAKLIDQEVVSYSEQGQEVTKLQALKNLMAPKAYYKEEEKRTNATTKEDTATKNSNFIYGNRKLHNDTAARYDSIGRVLMNKDTQELNRIIGDDVKEARFTNTHPISGGKLETPHLLIYTKNSETTETERETYDNEGNPIITKNKTTGSSPKVFDVTNPIERGKALYLLNELMTKNNGSKVTDDQLKAYIDHLKQNEPGALFEAKYKKKEATSKQPSFRPWEKSEAKAKANDIIDSLLE